MNRRGFLSTLPAMAALRVSAESSYEPEMALSIVHPMCPKCGSCCLFMRRSEFVGDLVPVECGCGWKGVSPVAR